MIPLAPLVAAALPGDTITLAHGHYDDAQPVTISKDLCIAGPRDSIAHSEFQICGGANVRFHGFSMEMTKPGAAAVTGIPHPYPQNGMVVIRNATFWSDNMMWSTVPGLGLRKPAIHAFQGNVSVRAISRFSRIDWRDNPARVIELLYGAYCNLFGWPTVVDQDGWDSTLAIPCAPDAAAGSAIQVVGSDLVMSGSHLSNWGGGAQVGVSVARRGYRQVGAGFYTTINGFAVPTMFDATPCSGWVAPGCIG